VNVECPLTSVISHEAKIDTVSAATFWEGARLTYLCTMSLSGVLSGFWGMEDKKLYYCMIPAGFEALTAMFVILEAILGLQFTLFSQLTPPPLLH
jgi:hypothetical protein